MRNTAFREELSIDSLKLKKAALILRAINNPLRQQVLQLIHKKGRVNVTEIYKCLYLEQSVASQHLSVLRKAGFVLPERNGKQVFYMVNYERLDEIQELTSTRLL